MTADKKGNLSLPQVEIRILALPQNLCIARAAMQKSVEVAGLCEQDVDAITLALDEALTNAIQHSYGGACEKPIVVQLSLLTIGSEKKNALEIIVRDYGKQVDPQTIKSRDLEDIRPGGIGVHIIKSVMDKVEYSCPLDGGMQLRMIKYYSSVSHKVSSDIDSSCR